MPDNEFVFQDADSSTTSASIRVRTFWNGPSGSGKTYSALSVGTALADLLEPVYGFRPTIYGIDTERESMLLYRKDFKFKHMPMVPPHTVARYLRALEVVKATARPGDIVLLDSGTHAWSGPGGILERVDKEMQKFAGNKWAAWSILTPEQNKFIDTLLSLDQHLFMTTRSKTEWEQVDVQGKKVPKRVGTAPIQREGLEYEATVAFDITNAHVAHVGKTRIKSIADESFMEPGMNLAKHLFGFLMTGRGDPTPEALAEGIAKYKANPPTFKPPPPVTKPAEVKTSPTDSSATNVTHAVPAKDQTVEVKTSSPQSEHERLAKVFVDAMSANDIKTLRSFPGMVAAAAKAKTIDKIGFDDLVSSFNKWKGVSK